MARRVHPTPTQAVLKSSAELTLRFATPRRSKGQRNATPVARLNRLIKFVDGCVETEDWPAGNRGPEVLVALFCWAHEQIYGVSCVAEVARNFGAAYNSAERLMRSEFDNDFTAVVEFLRWVWKRERAQEKWRRENTGYGKVLTWRTVFRDGELLKMMRLDNLRTKGVL